MIIYEITSTLVQKYVVISKRKHFFCFSAVSSCFIENNILAKSRELCASSFISLRNMFFWKMIEVNMCLQTTGRIVITRMPGFSILPIVIQTVKVLSLKRMFSKRVSQHVLLDNVHIKQQFSLFIFYIALTEI